MTNIDHDGLRRGMEEAFSILGIPVVAMERGVLVCVPPTGRALYLPTEWTEEAHRLGDSGAVVVQIDTISDALRQYQDVKGGEEEAARQRSWQT